MLCFPQMLRDVLQGLSGFLCESTRYNALTPFYGQPYRQ